MNKQKNLYYSQPGELNPRSKLTDMQVKEIRDRVKAGEQAKQIYEDYKHTGITLGSFRNVACGFNRKWIK